MRGDPPLTRDFFSSQFQSTPHARGSTPIEVIDSRLEYVYPACAGIHLSKAMRPITPICLPRMRGDPPVLLPG